MSKIILSEEVSRQFVSSLFQKIGASKEHADMVAAHLSIAEMRGQASHGLSRIPFYSTKLQHGGYKIQPKMSLLSETDSSALLDADDSLGVVAGTYAMDLCIQKAHQTGCATVSVTHCNHIGFLAYYTLIAAQKDMIGIAICNSGASTAVSGTTKPVLGTNPFSVALPANRHRPVVLDCATSVVAQGKVAVANMEGEPIPDHWAYDQYGNPTTVAKDALAGTMRPFGDYKGSGISMMISLMCCGLTGMPFDMEKETLERIHDLTAGSSMGAMFMAIDIRAFLSPDIFKDRVDQFIDIVKQYDRIPGVSEIYVPGEKEFNQAALREDLGGFEIGPNLFQKLKEVSSSYGLEYDFDSWIIQN